MNNATSIIKKIPRRDFRIRDIKYPSIPIHTHLVKHCVLHVCVCVFYFCSVCGAFRVRVLEKCPRTFTYLDLYWN